MQEAREKILIIIIALFVVFDPGVQKIRNSKEYLHSLFRESFSDEEAPDSVKNVMSMYSSQNAFK